MIIRKVDKYEENSMLRRLTDTLAIDIVTFRAYQSGTVSDLQSKNVEVLLYLFENKHRIVPQEELIDNFWDGNFYVGRQGVLRTISTVRKFLGDNLKEPRYICTYRKKGYRYVNAKE